MLLRARLLRFQALNCLYNRIPAPFLSGVGSLQFRANARPFANAAAAPQKPAAPDFFFQELFETVKPKDVQYKKLTSDHVFSGSALCRCVLTALHW